MPAGSRRALRQLVHSPVSLLSFTTEVPGRIPQNSKSRSLLEIRFVEVELFGWEIPTFGREGRLGIGRVAARRLYLPCGQATTCCHQDRAHKPMTPIHKWLGRRPRRAAEKELFEELSEPKSPPTRRRGVDLNSPPWGSWGGGGRRPHREKPFPTRGHTVFGDQTRRIREPPPALLAEQYALRIPPHPSVPTAAEDPLPTRPHGLLEISFSRPADTFADRPLSGVRQRRALGGRQTHGARHRHRARLVQPGPPVLPSTKYDGTRSPRSISPLSSNPSGGSSESSPRAGCSPSPPR